MSQNIDAYPLNSVTPLLLSLEDTMAYKVQASALTLARLITALKDTSRAVLPRKGHEKPSIKGYVPSARGFATLCETQGTPDDTFVVVTRLAYVDTPTVYKLTCKETCDPSQAKLPHGDPICVSSATPKMTVSLRQLQGMLTEDIALLQGVNGRGTKHCLNMHPETFESIRKMSPSAVMLPLNGGNPTLWGTPCASDPSLTPDRICLVLAGGVKLAWKVYNVQMEEVPAEGDMEETDLVPPGQVGWPSPLEGGGPHRQKLKVIIDD